jgi:hypothetical protein
MKIENVVFNDEGKTLQEIIEQFLVLYYSETVVQNG